MALTAKVSSVGFCLLLGVSSDIAVANRFADNPDKEVNRLAHPELAPIGRLEGIETATVGNAFLISPCLILTNHHVVFGNNLEPLAGADYRMTFMAGLDAKFDFLGKTIATPIAWGKRDYRNRNDWAILKLRACVGARRGIGWFETDLRAVRTIIGQTATVFSFSDGEKGASLRSARGKLTEFYRFNDTIKFSGSTLPGSSGGPVFLLENGGLKLVGVNRGVAESGAPGRTDYDHYTTVNANTVLPLRTVLSPDVQEMIRGDIAQFGFPNPAFSFDLPKLSRPN